MAEATRKHTQPLDRKARAKLPYREREIRSVEERIDDFKEISISFNEQRAKQEAARCLRCDKPGCVSACPLNNDIPAIMDLIEQGDFLGAARHFHKTSSFPDICGRICPQSDLCEGSCILKKRGAVHIRALEAFVADYQRQHGETGFMTGPSTGKKVAIVGGGPAGLSCASSLLERGHEVTVIDSRPLAGGLLIYGIPGFKLSKTVPLKVLDDLKQVGIHFELNTKIGPDRTVDDLLDKDGYGAVYIATGALIDSRMNIPGEDLPGVYSGTEFLIRANVDEQHLPEGMSSNPEVGNRVVVIGGGDTAYDCLRTALRLGAQDVSCILLYRRTEQEMPGTEKDRRLAQDEGAKFQFLTQPVAFLPGDDGNLKAIECIRMEMGEPDDSGRRRPVSVEGSNFNLEVDTAIMALGYKPDRELTGSTPGLETNDWGLIVVDPETGATSRPGVFSGGDIVRGPNLAVNAMADGRKAASAIDAYLAGL